MAQIPCRTLLPSPPRGEGTSLRFRRTTQPGSGRLAPASPELEAAADACAELQAANGGDLRIGKKLGSYLCDAGFTNVRIEARYDCYPSLKFIGEYLALQLEKAGMPQHVNCLREWSNSETGLFAQSWVSAIGTKPG
jgi:hypothetical protein